MSEPTPMTPERLEQLRETIGRYKSFYMPHEMLAEIDRARSESTEAWAEVQRLETEVDRLRAERFKLRHENEEQRNRIIALYSRLGEDQ